MTDRARAVGWRVLQVATGLLLFVFSMKAIEPLALSRGVFIAVAAVLMAGSMAITDSLVGLLAGLYDKLQKGRRA